MVRPSGSLALLLLLVPPAALLATPAGAAQTVVGRVVRAADGSGVAGAEVVLLDGGLREAGSTVTGDVGDFILPAAEGGSYVLVVRRPGWASHVSSPLELRDGVLLDHRMVVDPVPASRLGQTAVEGPSYLQVREDHLLELCGAAFEPGRQGVLAGTVVDARTGYTVPYSTAVAEWDAIPGRAAEGGPAPPGRLELAVGETGAFVYCGVPAGVRVRMRAVGGGAVGAVASAPVFAGRVTPVELPLPVTGPAMPEIPAGEGSVLGRVVDHATGEPVEAAEVTLSGGAVRAVTDANGRFAMEAVPAGRHVLAVDHVAFPHQEIFLGIRPGAGHDVRVRMVSDAIPLPPLTVTIRSSRWFRDMRGFTHRASVGAGRFFAPEEIRRRAPATLLDVLRSVPGVRVHGSVAGSPPDIEIRGRRCAPTVWVDRVRRGGGDPFTAIRGAELEAVEVYRGRAEVPAAFAGPDDACGAVVVWTRKALLASR